MNIPAKIAIPLAFFAPVLAALIAVWLTLRSVAPDQVFFVTPGIGAILLVVSGGSGAWIYFGVVRRVTRLAEAAKREVADVTAALDAHSIVAITDPSGKISYVNDKFCEISKYSREELLGQDHRLINSGTHPKEFFRDLWGTIASGKVWRGEIRNRAKDGTYYWVDTTIFPFLGENGKPRQYVAIRTDITSRKEDELKLVRAARELSEKNKELETMVYVVSHDLRTPLLNVQGFGAALIRSCEELAVAVEANDRGKVAQCMDSEIPRAVRFIKAGIAKMDSLLTGFLKFSRSGRVPMNIQDVDVEKVVEGSIQAMKFQIEQASAEIVVGTLPRCRGDAALLGQVFSNLLDNALKYRQPRRPCTISVYGGIEDGNVTYTVTDNGLGIPIAQQGKVFELFHRLDPKASEGEGLGLTISQRMVERQGGRIWIASETGGGTTFHISLPAALR